MYDTATQIKKIVFPLIVIVLLLIIITGLGIGSRQRHNTLKMLIVGDSIGEGAGASGPSLKWYKYLAPYMKEAYGIKLILPMSPWEETAVMQAMQG